MSVNKLFLGDNLEIMKSMETESIDLIYLDPPFFSNRNYEVIWGDKGEIRSFQDRWAGGIDHYIAWLKERVEQMHRILKSTGSIFLHCDWHADAYIRVEILDKVFGYKNFKNEIVWCYKSGGASKKIFSRKHDVIFFYTKSNKWVFNFEKEKSYGQPGGGQGGKVEYFKDEKGTYSIVGIKDWWEISMLSTTHPERIGYPTQKPEALLERIIKCASNPGDIVLDPFVGGGTTVVVADRLERGWIGIDQSVQAIAVTEMRLQQKATAWSLPFTKQLHKYDYDTLRYKDAFEFESFIIGQFGGIANTRQRNDFGLDGKMPDNTPLQVKRSDNIGRIEIDKFLSAVKRADKQLYEKNIANGNPIGYIIAFSFGKGAIQEVARLKNQENIIIKLVTVDTILPIANKPSISLTFNHKFRDDKGNNLIEFIAVATSETGIEFFAWDFGYDKEKGFNPDVFYDKQGKQEMKFKPGQYKIAVKVYDIDGLESIETIELTVNGVISRN